MDWENREHQGDYPMDGSIRIGEDVVSTIASQAAREVQGVAQLGSGLSGVFGKKSAGTGIKVEIKDEQAFIDVMLILEFGARIPDVAWKVQERVKDRVERMTGLAVAAVNVHVQGLRFGQEGSAHDEGRVR